jgi:hypothetical protein
MTRNARSDEGFGRKIAKVQLALFQELGPHKAGPERQDMPLTGKTCSSCELPRKFQGSAVVSSGPGSSVLGGGCYGNLLKLRKFPDALIGQFLLRSALA